VHMLHCTLPSGQSLLTHSCMVDSSHNIIDEGNVLQFNLQANNTTTGNLSLHDSAFYLLLFGGSSKGCAPGTQRSVAINFLCAPLIAPGHPEFVSSSGCSSIFVWKSLYGCRACTEADYQTVTGVCDGSVRQVSKMRVNACNGQSEIMTEDGCASYEFPLVAVIAAVSSFAFVIALVALIAYLKFRKLRVKYSRVNEQSPAEPLQLTPLEALRSRAGVEWKEL